MYKQLPDSLAKCHRGAGLRGGGSREKKEHGCLYICELIQKTNDREILTNA